MPDPLVGREVDGYRIEEVLGRGGMGVVYKATQLSLGRPVAIKVLPEEVTENRQFLDRFEREIDILARLSHPNIVTVFERGSVDGRPYIVMELVRGTSLRDVMRNGPLPPSEALLVVRSVLSALEHAHEQGIVHRDIKPENVLVAPGGIVKVADFGLSRHLEGDHRTRLTKTYVALGTYEYMSPEQREMARDADARSDLYATGVVLYEMVAGELPIGAFEPLSRKRPKECDARIDGIVERSLKKEPASRFQDAREMGDAVSRLLSSVPPETAPEPLGVPAPVPAAADHGPRWKRVLSNIFGQEYPIARIEAKLPRKFAEKVLEDVEVQRYLGRLVTLWPHFPGGIEFHKQGSRLVLELGGLRGDDPVRDKRVAAAVGAVLEANAHGKLRRIAVADPEWEDTNRDVLARAPIVGMFAPIRPSEIPVHSQVVSGVERRHPKWGGALKALFWSLFGLAAAFVGVLWSRGGGEGHAPMPLMWAFLACGAVAGVSFLVFVARGSRPADGSQPQHNYWFSLAVTALWVGIVVATAGDLRDEEIAWLCVGAIASVFLLPRIPALFRNAGRALVGFLAAALVLALVVGFFWASVGADSIAPESMAIESVPQPASAPITTGSARIPDAAPIAIAQVSGVLPRNLTFALQSDAQIHRWVQSIVPVAERPIREGIDFRLRDGAIEMVLPAAWVREFYLSHWRTGGDWRSNAAIYFHAIAAAYGRAAEKLAPGRVRRSAVASEEFETAMDRRPLAVPALETEPEGDPLPPFLDWDLELAKSESDLPEELPDAIGDSARVREQLVALVAGADVIYEGGFDLGIEAGRTLSLHVPRDTQLALDRFHRAAGLKPAEAQKAVGWTVRDFAAALATAAHSFAPLRLEQQVRGSGDLERKLRTLRSLGDPLVLPDVAPFHVEAARLVGSLPDAWLVKFREDHEAWRWIREVAGGWPTLPEPAQVEIGVSDGKLVFRFDESWRKRALVEIWHAQGRDGKKAREFLRGWLEGLAAFGAVTMEARHPDAVKRTKLVKEEYERAIQVRPFKAR